MYCHSFCGSLLLRKIAPFPNPRGEGFSETFSYLAVHHHGVYSALTWPEASISCFTFGSPLVGSSQFVEVFGQLVGRSVRAVYGKEIVPSVPPSFLRFQHVTPAVWLRPKQQPHLELYPSGLTRPFGSRNIFPDHMMRNNNTTLGAAIAELDFVLGGAEDGGLLENRIEE